MFQKFCGGAIPIGGGQLPPPCPYGSYGPAHESALTVTPPLVGLRMTEAVERVRENYSISASSMGNARAAVGRRGGAALWKKICSAVAPATASRGLGRFMRLACLFNPHL